MPQAAPAPSTNDVITVADLAVREGEARIRDLDLARALGMADPHAIRRTIKKYRAQLETFGLLVSDVDRKPGPNGGRPGITHLLNRKQALYVTAKSETEKAAEATVMMVEVFDAYLAARTPAPAPAAAAALPAPLPFLAGPEPLVSSLHIAQALRRRHTGILRLLDVLAAERPELIGRHLRFSTYLHENGRPYRCFHLDRTGFDALMARIPSSDGAAEALRGVMLRDWPESPAADPDCADPTELGREGLPIVRIADQLVTVDTRVYRVRENEPVVRLHDDGRITIGHVWFDERFRLYGERTGMNEWRSTGRGPEMVRSPVAILGLVVRQTPVLRKGLLTEKPSVQPSLGSRSGSKRAVRHREISLPLTARLDLAEVAPLGAA